MRLNGFEMDDNLSLDEIATNIFGHLKDFSFYLRKLGTPEALEVDGEKIGNQFEKCFWILNNIERIQGMNID